MIVLFQDIINGHAGGWVAGVSDTNQYFQVDMQVLYKFTKVHIQGREDENEWVTSFKLLYYDAKNSNWTAYVNNNGQEVCSAFHISPLKVLF